MQEEILKNPECISEISEIIKKYFGVNIVNNPKNNFDFVNTSTNEDPDYATDEASGFDLRADINPNYASECVDGVFTINPREFKVIPTGLYFDLPKGYEMQIRPRSGLAAKYGVTVLNSPGTIDSDYIGEIKVILINHGVEPFHIKQGDRIAQAVISTSKESINLNRVEKITKVTDRNVGGFGSTGMK